MNDELERLEGDSSGIGTMPEFAGGTEQNHENLSQDSWPSGRDLNPGPPCSILEPALGFSSSYWSITNSSRIFIHKYFVHLLGLQ
jgi:hypothetical protein